MPTHRSARRSPLPALVAGVSLLVLSALGAATPAHAADEATFDGVTYELIDAANPSQGASATDYDEDANPEHPHLALASEVEIDGEAVPVVEVGHNAFRDSGLESVFLPGSVVELGPYAFGYNTDLATVTFSEGLELIGTGAFRQGSLTEIDLPDSVSRINPQAFFGNQLTNIIIPPQVDTLTIGVFQRNALTHIDVPAHVTKIRERAFAENDLTLVSLPETLAEIGEGVFSNNPALNTVVFFGPEPALVNQGTTTPGDGNPIAVDAETDPTIRFPWRHGEGQAASGGFTTPEWWGFDSLPVATVTFHNFDVIHATRFVPLDQAGGAGLWGTIPDWNMPPDPVRDGHEFAYWHAYGSIWGPGDPITGDLELRTGWIDLGWVQNIILTAAPEEATAGEPVTITAEGFNAHGDSLGDITDEILFDDPADSSIVREENRFTFSDEGTYTISGVHSVTERPVSLQVDVRPASTTVVDNEEGEATTDEDEDSTVPEDEESTVTDDEKEIIPEDDQPPTLPATGTDIGLPATGTDIGLSATGTDIAPGTGLAGALALILGSWLLIVSHRKSEEKKVAL